MDIFTVLFYAILQWYVHSFTREMQRFHFIPLSNWNIAAFICQLSHFQKGAATSWTRRSSERHPDEEIITRRSQWGWTFVMKTLNWDHCVWLSDSNAGTSAPNGGNSFLINSCIINHAQKCYAENQSCWVFLFFVVVPKIQIFCKSCGFSDI